MLFPEVCFLGKTVVVFNDQLSTCSDHTASTWHPLYPART